MHNISVCRYCHIYQCACFLFFVFNYYIWPIIIIIIIIRMCVKRLRNMKSDINIYNSPYAFQIRLSYRSSSRYCRSERRRAKVHEPCFIQVCKARAQNFTSHHITSHHISSHQGLVTWIHFDIRVAMAAKPDGNFTQTLPSAGACRQHCHIVPTECNNLVGVPLIKKKNLNLLLFSM